MGTKGLKARTDWTKTGEVADLAKVGRQRTRRSIADRLSAKIDRSRGIEACWPFQGSLQQHNGYGQIWDISPKTGKPSMRSAHVVAWELYHQMRVPAGLHVLHAQGCCQSCCNPRHLRLGTRHENMADARDEMRLKSRKLNPEKAFEIIGAFDAGVSIPSLSEKYGVTEPAIWQCVTGVTYDRYTNRRAAYVPRPKGRPSRGEAARRSSLAGPASHTLACKVRWQHARDGSRQAFLPSA